MNSLYKTFFFTLQDFKFNVSYNNLSYHLDRNVSILPTRHGEAIKEYYHKYTLRDCNNNLHISCPIPDTVTRNMIFTFFTDSYKRYGHETYGILYKSTDSFNEFEQFIYDLPFEYGYGNCITSYIRGLRDIEIKYIALTECEKYMCDDVISIVSSYL